MAGKRNTGTYVAASSVMPTSALPVGPSTSIQDSQLVRGPGFAEKVRQDILKKRGKVRTGRGKVEDNPIPRRDPRKTHLMLLIEMRHGQSIEELIALGEIADVGRELGIDPSTVSKWRLRFGMR